MRRCIALYKFTCPRGGGSRFLRNVSKFLPECMVLCERIIVILPLRLLAMDTDSKYTSVQIQEWLKDATPRGTLNWDSTLSFVLFIPRNLRRIKCISIMWMLTLVRHLSRYLGTWVGSVVHRPKGEKEMHSEFLFGISERNRHICISRHA
jgi:hypothetical protein